MKPIIVAVVMVVSAWGLTHSALAGDKDPIEITADNALEWDRAQSTFIARGNARAAQGSMAVNANMLTVSYTDGDKGMVVTMIHGEGQAKIETETAKAYGDEALYDVGKEYAVLTGSNPHIETDVHVLTAKSKIEYYTGKNKMMATGGVVISNPDGTLQADNVTAFFKKAADGSTALDNVKANGHIVMKTKDEILYGDQADYSATKDYAVVTGNVRIERGRHIMMGQRAEFDMKKNISSMSAMGENGRVKGIFYPAEKGE